MSKTGAGVFRICLCAATLLAFGRAAEANVRIASAATHNMTCSKGLCTPDAKKAVLNVDDLASMLAAGDVRVISDQRALDIDVDAALSWTSPHRLTLDAWRSIAFNQSVNLDADGALTLTTNHGGTGGDFAFAETGKAHIAFAKLQSSLIINGNSYVLAGTLQDLAADMGNDLNGFYALAGSYDASADGTYTVSALPDFAGTFEGLGNAVSNYSLQLAGGNTAGGLFQCACPSSTVRDVDLVNVTIRGNSGADDVGALAGIAYGTVQGISASGSVGGDAKDGANDSAGGLLGLSHGLVVHSRSRVKVRGAQVAGGLVGILQPSGAPAATISYSSAGGDVSGVGAAGGLVGLMDQSFGNEEIDHSYAAGNVTGSGGAYVGGLVGTGKGTIVRSFATGTVSARRCAACGGLAGSSGGSITDSYATGALNVGNCDACGGLLGDNSGTVATSYATGSLLESSGTYLGGLIGADAAPAGSLSNTYWDTTTSGITDPAQGAGNISNDQGIAGLTTAELQAGLPAGFSPSVWGENSTINNGLPYLLALPPNPR
ncbi:MAG TPA: hypothetical protein VHT03_01490 [Rhizomicrobium sp.]|jgi:hypothetical protein|nr:hypothetical protein [Rhizomicrobium sp.]